VFSINLDFMARNIEIGGPSTQWWTQLSLAVAAGLTFGTILTLVVTPCALMARDNYRDWRSKRKSRSGGGMLKAFTRRRRPAPDGPPIANAAE
jgi:multidrug efflux pump